MMILLMTTGIRVHELASLETSCGYTTLNDEGIRYHWIKGVSEKTDEGVTEWLCPELVHQAIAVAERLALPSQRRLQDQISVATQAGDILEASKLSSHKNQIFLGIERKKKNRIATLSKEIINLRLKRFVTDCGLDWDFTTHQCRRTFAVYVVRSALGDLRYLRDHYKHWSLDMTTLYAANEAQDREIFDEIYLAAVNEKTATVKHWFEPDTPLAGGLAKSIKVFRNSGESVRTYNTQADMVKGISDTVSLRATGVAWCTADHAGCAGGKGIDKTKCGDCSGSVIDDKHQSRWEAIYVQQIELVQLEGIGETGRTTAKRALKRCEEVLTDLGADINSIREVAENG